MNKKNLIKQIRDLSSRWGDVPDADIIAYKIKDLLLNYLEKNPADVAIWLRLATLELTVPPFEMLEDLIAYIDNIYKYEPNNIYATLLVTMSYWIFRGYIPEKIITKLEQLESDNNKMNSMIEYAKALCYENKKELYEKKLLKSIEYCDIYVNNYRKLGEFYIEQGHKEKGEALLKKSDENLHTYSPGEKDEYYDITDVEAFLDWYYKGYSVVLPFCKKVVKNLHTRANSQKNEQFC